jgi:signal transduction histidine kinase
LTAVKLNLGLALEYKDNATIIKKCEKNIETVMEEIRKITKQLILPSNLKELGLVQSIHNMMKETLQHTNISLKIFAKGVDESLLSEEQKLTVYRIIQEQLSNVLKHSEASSVAITVGVSNEKIRFRIVDNGKGFDASKKRNGIGLTNIINRAGLFNGKVNISSQPGQGCSLEVELNSKQPLPFKSNSVTTS